jgi:hypothetical protein
MQHKFTSKKYRILSYEEINFFKKNKDQITHELLSALRKHGNPGKQLALDILDIEKDSDGWYLDAGENRISFDGNRMLKKQFSKINLSPIHIEEIEKCSNDIFYFMDNYIKLVTKAGVNFPELRPYQREFIEEILPDANESIVSPQPRQAGKSTTVGIYLTHCGLFKRDINIGICANKAPMAREFLDKCKKMYLELPVWMKVGSLSWNKSSIEFDNGVKIMTDATSSDSFRGFSMHLLVIDEVAFIRPTVWNEFEDSIFPSQSALAWKKNILISTSNGMNQFYGIVKGARTDTNGYKIFEVNWRDVPRFNIDGSVKDPDIFKAEIIAKYGEVYFAQNYELAFIGSSHTLIPGDSLKEFTAEEPIRKMSPGLNVYKKPEKGHKYILSVDPAKDGKDAFAVQIIDITDMNFEQVASGQFQIDYLLMPEYLVEWGEWYNFAFIIIENNEGAGQSIADSLYKSYEYENLYFDVKTESSSTNLSKSRKRYPGFRTTPKSRKLILTTMKTFIENGRLKINDKKTIDEFYTFILKNGKYQADDGAFDDAVMSLAIAFAPFCNTKNFSDMKKLVDILYKKSTDENDGSEKNKIDLSEIFSIGGFDDGTDINEMYSIQSSGNNQYGHVSDEFGGVVNYYDTLDFNNF